MTNPFTAPGRLGSVLLFALAAGCCSLAFAAPFSRAHSHNDYEHTRPLLDALDQGFCSVEADIYLVEGKLLVAHDRKDVKPERTLQALYLDPLKARVAKNGGQVHPGGTGFTLLIDIKEDGAGVYGVLRPVLADCGVLLTRFTPTNTVPGAITVILSGDRPTEMVAADPVRWCGIDGRFAELTHNPSPHLVPLVSDRWSTHFGWFKDGKLAEADRTKLRELVARAHREGRRIRFWGAQDQEYVWREQFEAGVDLINTDKLAQLRAYLSAATRPAKP
jgi:hypothetical protein